MPQLRIALSGMGENAFEFRRPILMPDGNWKVSYRLISINTRSLAGKKRVDRLGKRIDIGGRHQPRNGNDVLGSDCKRTVFRRRIDIGADASDRGVGLMYTGDTEIGDLHRRAVLGQQQILRLDVAMDYRVVVGMAEAGTYLLDIAERIL